MYISPNLMKIEGMYRTLEGVFYNKMIFVCHWYFHVESGERVCTRIGQGSGFEDEGVIDEMRVGR